MHFDTYWSVATRDESHTSVKFRVRFETVYKSAAYQYARSLQSTHQSRDISIAEFAR